MPVIEQKRERYLRSPRLVRDPASGRVTLHVLAWEPGGERVIVYPVADDGGVGEPSLGQLSERIVALDHATPPGPTDDAAIDDRHEADGYRVEVRREGYRSTVVLARPRGDEVVVFDAHGTAAAPFVACAHGGAVVAFHHNVREDDGTPDLAKWIALRFVDDEGRLFEPAREMLDRDRDREGEEQSFEMPTLAVGDDGAIALFGRGSHQFHRQDLDASGFSRRVPLGDGAWGCRGRRVSVVRAGEGALLSARRERPGIVVERLEAPRGGAPAWRPVDARVGAATPLIVPVDTRTDLVAADGRLTLFGDIHQHSAHSDGIGTADEPYLRARYVYGDDFCALTDHESFLGKRIGPGEWSLLERAAERHDEPGRFATLVAYEWTGRMHPGPGHKVVYLPREGERIVSRDDVPDGSGIVAAARAMGALAVPHHVGWTGADEGAHDPEVQPVWEICSCHGCYESFAHELGQRGDLRDQMVDAVLRRGHRFGFIASSDGHGLLHHHGVARKRDPFRTGLAAVQAEGRTRDAILAALRERRCYATSGAKILLDVRAGGRPMGSAIRARGAVLVEAKVHGTAALTRFELVGPDGVLATAEVEGARAELRAELFAPYVYARVKQSDGEMAWSSPVFMDRE